MLTQVSLLKPPIKLEGTTMVSSASEVRPGMKGEIKDTLLTPRFYTTDFQEMESLDINEQEPEFRAVLQEFIADYNRNHFVRDLSLIHI